MQVWKGECQQGSQYLNIFVFRFPEENTFWTCNPFADLISESQATWLLGWVLFMEPEFSGSLKIYFPFPSLFSISCGNPC